MSKTQTADVAVILNEKVNNALANNNKVLFEKAFAMSNAIVELKTLLTPEVMKPIMALQGNKLGFKTDKDKTSGYTEDEVKNCIIEATLSGLQVVGNQFNIIGGNMYGTKEGFGFLLQNIPGLHYEIIFELPRIKPDNTGAAVIAHVSWTIEGKSFKRKLDLPIKMNAYMGADAVLGKAERKARKWLYSTLTGTDIGEGDIQDVPHTVVAEAKPVEEVKAEKQSERLLGLIESAQNITELSALKVHVKTEPEKEVYNKKLIELGKVQKEKTEEATALTNGAGGGTN